MPKKNLKISRQDVLTPRQLDCLYWAALGETNAQIAKRESITVRTVKAHLESGRHRLGAKNRAHLITQSFRRGVLTFMLLLGISAIELATLGNLTTWKRPGEDAPREDLERRGKLTGRRRTNRKNTSRARRSRRDPLDLIIDDWEDLAA